MVQLFLRPATLIRPAQIFWCNLHEAYYNLNTYTLFEPGGPRLAHNAYSFSLLAYEHKSCRYTAIIILQERIFTVRNCLI